MPFQSVYALNSLSNGRYQALYAVYDQLTNHLHTVVAGREDRMGQNVTRDVI
ncbi:MAG: hypothetical protein ACUVQV_09235 [Dissulfurimicrobium sp.]|uniref:hypothetical protein n=1 Tax=Dissulfurimicrobium sp. TaxID=2022436 RepID=UPI00404A8603